MKLSKALKLKNRLAGEITKLKGIIQARNVTEFGQETVYDVKTIVETTLPKVIENLVTVKTAIAIANAMPIMPINKTLAVDLERINLTPYWDIFMIAELKGLIETVKEINTKNGKFSEFRGLRETVAQVEYVAQVKQQDVDRLVSEMEKKIDGMQDDLDAFNATLDIEILDSISIQ